MASISTKKRHRDEAALISRIFQHSEVPLGKRLRHFLAGTWLLIVFGILVSVIAFWGRPPHAPTIYVGLEPNYTFTAPKDFEFKSDILRRERQAEARAKTAQAYRIDLEPAERQLAVFSAVSDKIAADYANLEKLYVRSTRVDAISKIFSDLKQDGADSRLGENEERIAMSYSQLIQYCGSRERFELLFTTAEDVYLRLAKSGIYDTSTFGGALDFSQFRVVSKKAFDTERFQDVFIRTLSSELWRKVFVGESSSNLNKVTQTVLSLFSDSGLMTANMMQDEEETRRLRDEAASRVTDVIEKVRAGEPLLIKGVRVNESMFERWKAFCADTDRSGLIFSGASAVSTFASNLVYAFCILLVGILFCVLVIPGVFRKKRGLWLAAVLILLNLGAIRGVLELLETPRFEEAFSNFNNIQGWLAAPAIVAIIAAMTVGIPFSIAISVFVGAIVTLMVGGSAGFFMASTVAVLVSVYTVRGAMKRATLVRAGVYAGLAVAASALPISLHAGTPLIAICYGIGASVGIGFICGIVAAGVLPIFESIFKITTNVTLLELSDYNHPLLRKLQVIAPGTFHHCVMVADYAARAAGEIGANATLCRCAALYHDVGKTLKPEYFTENQNNTSGNPHETITPSMSALIIKSHVREGAELAVEYHLPAPVREIIEQHHGTSFTGYFLRKAKELASFSSEKIIIDESNYRYEGPKPQTVEAAVVMFSDIVEAASRSLKRITAQGVEDMVNKLVMDRFSEGELDECPITITQVYAVRKSLVASVMMTFHSRVEYPKEGESVLKKNKEVPEKPKVRVQAKAIPTTVAQIRGGLEIVD